MRRASATSDVLSRPAPPAPPIVPRRNAAGQVLERPNTTAAGQRYARARVMTPASTLLDLARQIARDR